MAFEAVRGYVQLASGLGEMTKAKALETAQGLLALPASRRDRQAGDAGVCACRPDPRGGQGQPLQPHRAGTDRDRERPWPRRVRASLGRGERPGRRCVAQPRGRGAAGLGARRRGPQPAGADDPGQGLVSGDHGSAPRLAEGGAPAAEPVRPRAAGTRTSAGSASATKTAAKKAAAKKTAAKKTTAKKTAAKKTTAKKAAAKKTTAAKKTAAKKATAKKTAAKKTAAKKTTPRSDGEEDGHEEDGSAGDGAHRDRGHRARRVRGGGVIGGGDRNRGHRARRVGGRGDDRGDAGGDARGDDSRHED